MAIISKVHVGNADYDIRDNAAWSNITVIEGNIDVIEGNISVIEGNIGTIEGNIDTIESILTNVAMLNATSAQAFSGNISMPNLTVTGAATVPSVSDNSADTVAATVKYVKDKVGSVGTVVHYGGVDSYANIMNKTNVSAGTLMIANDSTHSTLEYITNQAIGTTPCASAWEELGAATKMLGNLAYQNSASGSFTITPNGSLTGAAKTNAAAITAVSYKSDGAWPTFSATDGCYTAQAVSKVNFASNGSLATIKEGTAEKSSITWIDKANFASAGTAPGFTSNGSWNAGSLPVINTSKAVWPTLTAGSNTTASVVNASSFTQPNFSVTTDGTLYLNYGSFSNVTVVKTVTEPTLNTAGAVWPELTGGVLPNYVAPTFQAGTTPIVINNDAIHTYTYSKGSLPTLDSNSVALTAGGVTFPVHTYNTSGAKFPTIDNSSAQFINSVTFPTFSGASTAGSVTVS